MTFTMTNDETKTRLKEAERQLDYWLTQYEKHGDTRALEALNRAHVTLADAYETCRVYGGGS